jgi:archaellum component FlaC
MFNLFKKKTAVEKLQNRYKKLMSEWHDLSSTDLAASDEKYAQAQEVLNEIDKITS